MKNIKSSERHAAFCNLNLCGGIDAEVYAFDSADEGIYTAKRIVLSVYPVFAEYEDENGDMVEVCSMPEWSVRGVVVYEVEDYDGGKPVTHTHDLYLHSIPVEGTDHADTVRRIASQLDGAWTKTFRNEVAEAVLDVLVEKGFCEYNKN